MRKFGDRTQLFASPMRHLAVSLAVIFLAAGCFLALPGSAALANSAPPPGVLWFYLDFPEERGQLNGAQLWGCADSACADPVLLQAWEQCTDARCLPGPAQLETGGGVSLNRFECGGDICRSAAYRYPSAYFLIALQFADVLRLQSEPLPLPDAYGETFSYRISISADGTALALDETLRRGGPVLPMPPLLPYFGLTLLVELLAAGVYAALRWKANASGHIARLAQIMLINLLTYPVVWGLFPALLRFVSPGGRLLGWAVAAFMLALSALFWMVFNAGSQRSRVIWTAGIVIFFLIGAACLVVFAFAALYPSNHPLASGLPVWLALLLAEAYAVLIEALLLFGFTHRSILLREALLVSLIMNMASFVIGLLFAL